MQIVRKVSAGALVESIRPALALLAVLAFATRALADDTPKIRHDTPKIRRVYVPSDRVSELGAQFPELRSLSRHEFDELLRRARSADATMLPLIESARYEARLDGDTIVGGAELAVRGRSAARGLLRWPASAWQITDASWGADLARIGNVGGGQLGLIVPAGESHKLAFSWSAAARRMEGGWRIELEVPPSLRSDLVLDLPPGLTPSMPGAQLSGPTDAPRPELKRWTARWSPASSIQLLLLQDGGPRQPAAQIFYDRELDVDVAEDAAEFVARFNLTIAHDPIRRIEIEHTPGLAVYSWSGVSVYDWESRDNRLMLELAEPLAGPAQLTLRAVASGSSTAKWQLPRLEIVGGHWTGGRTRVRAEDGVNLHDVKATHGRIASRLGPERTQPEFVVEHAVPDPGLTATVSRDRPQIFARVHTTLQFTPRPQAAAAVRWQVGTGEVSELRLRVPAGWSVESVDAAQGLIARWTLESGDKFGQVLNLRLNRAHSEDAVIQAEVLLRGPELDATAPDAVLDLPRLVPLDSHVSEETIAVEQSPAWNVELEHATGLSLVSRAATTGTSPVSAPPAATYRVDGAEAAGRLALHRQSPSFSAEMDTAIEVDADTIRVKYAIDVELLSGQPEWLDVVFSVAAREHLSWELPTGTRVESLANDGDVAARNGGDVWRVVLPRGAGHRLHLAANWRSAASDSSDVPLPTVAQAAATTGDVSVSAPAFLAVTPIVEGLAPLVAPPSPNDRSRQSPSAREHAWRYSQPAPRLRLGVAKSPQAATPAAWVARTFVTAELDVKGNAIHRVSYAIHSPVGSEFTVELPAGAELRQAHATDGPLARTDAGLLRAVNTSAGSPWHATVEYIQPTCPLGRWSEREWQLPRVSLPSLRTTWELRVPSSYQAILWSREFVAAPPHAGKSWHSRLFGPLARRGDDEPFRFWIADSWQTWWTDRAGTQPDPLEHQLNDALGEFVRDVRPRERTWARLLEHLNYEFGHRLLVDSVALEAAEMDLNAPVRLSDDANHDALTALDSSAAARLLRTHRGLLFTTREQAEAIGDMRPGARLRRLSDRGGLLQGVDQALVNGTDSSGRFVLLDHWVARPREGAHSQPQWLGEAAGARDVWRFDSTAESRSFSVTLIPSLYVSQTTAVICALCVMLACVMRPGGSKLRVGLFGLLGGTGFAMALTLPDAFTGPAAAFAWSQLALACAAARRRPESASDGPRGVALTLPGTMRQAATGAIVLAVLWTPRVLCGQSEPAQVPAARDAIVFIPYDPEHPEKRHEVTRVLVPRGLHERLIQAESPATEVDRQVLIRSANYVATLAPDGAKLAIDFDLEKLSADQSARCVLPLGGFLLRQAQLDGESCLLRQEPEGFSIELAQSGVHRLHLEGALAVEGANRQRVIDQPIPPVPSAKFTAELSPGINVELEGAVRPPVVTVSPDGNRLQADLGAASRLRVRWGREPAASPVVHVDAAHLWSWLSGPPQLHARLQAHVEAGSLTRLVIEPDPRLTLMRVHAPDLARYWVRAGTEAPQLILEFDRPIMPTVTVDLEFLLPEPAAGKLVLPEVRVAHAQTRAKLLAVRSDSAHRINVAESTDVQPVTPEEFQNVWGEPVSAAGRAFVVRAVGNAANLSVERIAQQTPSRLRTQASVRVGSGRIETSNHIAIAGSANKSFRQELLLPPGLHLGSVRASGGSQWRAITPDRLLWFGAMAENAAPAIDVEGWGPLDRREFALPLVRPADDSELTGDIVLWHTRDTGLATQDARGLSAASLRFDTKPPAAEFVADSAFTVDAADCSATLSVERMPATLTAAVATRLTVDDDATEWVSALDYQVAGGAFDALELRLPAGVKPPIEIEGEGIRQRTVRMDGANQIWRIDLVEPRWGAYRLLLRARLENVVGSVRVPIVVPQGVAESRQFLLIQNATERRLELRGLDGQPVAADTFARWFSEPVTNNVVASVEIRQSSGPIEVLAAETSETATNPTCVLERHHCWVRPNGTSLVQSRVLYQSRSTGDATLRLPNSASVLDFRLNGHAALSSPSAADTLTAHLEPSYRPHEVIVLWGWPAADRPSSARVGKIDLPRLTESACPSVWTVHAPEHLIVTTAASETTCRSQADATQAQILADEIVRILPLPKGVDATEPGEVLWDMERSFLATAYSTRRVLEIEAEVGLPTRELRVAHDRAATQLAELLEQNRQLVERFGLASLLARSEAQVQRLSPMWDSVIGSPAKVANGDEPYARYRAELELPPDGTTLYLVTNESDAAILYRDNNATGTAPLVPIAALGLAGALLALAFTGPRARVWLMPMGLLVAGLIWSWTLRPEPLGAAFLVAAVFVAIMRLARLRRTETAPASVASA